MPLDTEDLVKASVSDLNRFEVDDEDSYEKVVEAYKKFFPEEALPVSLEKKYTSGAASDAKTKKSMPSGINNDKEEKNSMPKKEKDDVEKGAESPEVEVSTPEVAEATDTTDLKKSLDEVQSLLKSAEARAEKAEKEAEDVKKAAQEAEIKKVKEDMTSIVKAYGLEKEEDLVEAIFKAGEGSTVILEVLESLHQKVEKTKETFGEKEHGEDGEADSPSDLEKKKTSVKDILAARKAKNTK